MCIEGQNSAHKGKNYALEGGKKCAQRKKKWTYTKLP